MHACMYMCMVAYIYISKCVWVLECKCVYVCVSPTTSMTATFWFLMRGCQFTYKTSYLWKLKKWNWKAYNHCTCLLCIAVQLDEMYDMCRFDKAWNIRQISPWCAVFSKEELQVCGTNLHDFYFFVYIKCIQNTAAFKLHVDNSNT